MSTDNDKVKPLNSRVPWHEQTQKVQRIYTCGACNTAVERYRALNNVPKHAHLCSYCWKNDPNYKAYVKVEQG